MLYVKQIKYPEQSLIFAPNFNLDMFPIIFMHGDSCPEIVDIKDKGFRYWVKWDKTITILENKSKSPCHSEDYSLYIIKLIK